MHLSAVPCQPSTTGARRARRAPIPSHSQLASISSHAGAAAAPLVTGLPWKHSMPSKHASSLPVFRQVNMYCSRGAHNQVIDSLMVHFIAQASGQGSLARCGPGTIGWSLQASVREQPRREGPDLMPTHACVGCSTSLVLDGSHAQLVETTLPIAMIGQRHMPPARISATLVTSTTRSCPPSPHCLPAQNSKSEHARRPGHCLCPMPQTGTRHSWQARTAISYCCAE